MAEERSPRYDEMVSEEAGQAYAYLKPELRKASSAKVCRSAGYLLAKRAFDFIASACALAVVWPLLVAISVAIRMDSKGPAIYKHQRIGKNNKPIRRGPGLGQAVPLPWGC